MARSLHRGLAGNTGEYAVASELSRRGWLATLMPGGAKEFDVLAIHSESGKQIALQVKTASPGRKAFQVRTEHEQPTKETNQWFAFVRLHPDLLERPTFDLVPRNVVAAILWAIRSEAESRGNKVGGWRNFLTDAWLDGSFREGWDSLLVPTEQVRQPIRAQEQGFVRTFGRPEDQQLFA
jgi:hypothetical protein